IPAQTEYLHPHLTYVSQKCVVIYVDSHELSMPLFPPFYSKLTDFLLLLKDSLWHLKRLFCSTNVLFSIASFCHHLCILLSLLLRSVLRECSVLFVPLPAPLISLM